VWALGNRANGGIARDVTDPFVARIHRMDVPSEAVPFQELQRPGGNCMRSRRSSDDRHGARSEEIASHHVLLLTRLLIHIIGQVCGAIAALSTGDPAGLERLQGKRDGVRLYARAVPASGLSAQVRGAASSEWS